MSDLIQNSFIFHRVHGGYLNLKKSMINHDLWAVGKCNKAVSTVLSRHEEIASNYMKHLLMKKAIVNRSTVFT